jgi:hypothetical protein
MDQQKLLVDLKNIYMLGLPMDVPMANNWQKARRLG